MSNSKNILILGAGGYLGSHLFEELSKLNSNVFGTYHSNQSRIEDKQSLFYFDVKSSQELKALLTRVRPYLVINTISYGNSSEHNDREKIYATNFEFVRRLFADLEEFKVERYIHLGSSSEYGKNCDQVSERAQCQGNSDYSLAKIAATEFLKFQAKRSEVHTLILRPFSVYGGREETSRLFPTLIKKLKQGTLPLCTKDDTARDFIYIDDFIDGVLKAIESKNIASGEVLNICTGIETKITDLFLLAKNIFNIDEEVKYSKESMRPWDVEKWSGNPRKAKELLNFQAKVLIEEGLKKCFKSEVEPVVRTEQGRQLSIIVACHNDYDHIPVMYERTKKALEKIDQDFEIIFVDDGSSDESREVIKKLSGIDQRVKGLSHTKSFGSQEAFLTGINYSMGDLVVLADSDLQDPPECIPKMLKKYSSDLDLVMAKRVQRAEGKLFSLLRQGFYRLLKFLSLDPIHLDVGDFSLMSAKLAKRMLEYADRPIFLRTLRSYFAVNFKKTHYARPQRLYGVSSNNFLKNLYWAALAVFSINNRFPAFVVVVALLVSLFTGASSPMVLLFLLAFICLQLHFLYVRLSKKPRAWVSSYILNGEEIDAC